MTFSLSADIFLFSKIPFNITYRVSNGLDSGQERGCKNEQHTAVKTWNLCDFVICMKQNQVSFDKIHSISEKEKYFFLMYICFHFFSLRVFGIHN